MSRPLRINSVPVVLLFVAIVALVATLAAVGAVTLYEQWSAETPTESGRQIEQEPSEGRQVMRAGTPLPRAMPQQPELVIPAPRDETFGSTSVLAPCPAHGERSFMNGLTQCQLVAKLLAGDETVTRAVQAMVALREQSPDPEESVCKLLIPLADDLILHARHQRVPTALVALQDILDTCVWGRLKQQTPGIRVPAPTSIPGAQDAQNFNFQYGGTPDWM